MLQALSWAALGTGFTFLMTTLGAAVVFFFVEEPRPQFQRTMLGFAAGVMTAASVWSLLLPAIEQSADFGVPGWLPAAAGLLLGVGFLSALDAVLPHLCAPLKLAEYRQNGDDIRKVVGTEQLLIYGREVSSSGEVCRYDRFICITLFHGRSVFSRRCRLSFLRNPAPSTCCRRRGRCS